MALLSTEPSTPAGDVLTNDLFVKETPPAPTRSSAKVVRYTDHFYKTEHEAYIRLGPHPRILRYHGWDQRGLLFDKHPAGDVLSHLLRHRDPPPSLSARLQWARDIAEGLAFVHSKGVVWVDMSLQNVLLSDDHTRAVLCDFAGSCVLPVPGHKPLAPEYKESQVFIKSIMAMPRYPHAMVWEGPGSPHPHPDWNATPHYDRFGYGVLLFCLIALRFPHSPYLVVREQELFNKVSNLHLNETFDTLGEVEEYAQFELIIRKCFRAEYRSSDDLAQDVKAACAAMPADAPLLQDRIQDPVLEFASSTSGRRLFPFEEDGFEEDDCEDFQCAYGAP
ncbi:kinase-like domain-containing protein [Mycena sp. CBHHK59/15]|nr:kinase-like domain-containing protein [Mycena sp. CBHHK59/15]